MNRDSADARPRYFWPLIALLVGIVVGLVIGWGIWPVKWTNAYPQDLRAAERNEYLAMVAESYATNRDLSLAQQRLGGWTEKEMAQLLTDLQQAALDTDARRAADVQLLSSALNLGVQPVGGVGPTPTTVPGNGGLPGGLGWLKTVCTAGLWILLAAGAVALFYYLFRLWRRSQQGARERSIADLQQPEARGFEPGTSRQPDFFDDIKAQWPDAGSEFEEITPASSGTRPAPYAYEPGLREEPYGKAALPPLAGQGAEPPSADLRSQVVELPSEPPVESSKRIPPPATGPRSTSGPARLGDYTAVYQGESDYDEAFDINDPVDGYMGQCGLQLNDPVGRARDHQAVALQVWLWDSSDPDTRVKVLMSEGAYRDTGLRSEQAGEHEVLSVRPGTEFTLETHDLLLRGQVERVAYAEQEPYRAVFSDFQVKLQAFRKS